MDGVYTIGLDQCMFGLRGRDEWGEAAAMIPTWLVTNMECAEEFLKIKRGGGHRHVHLVNNRAGPAAHYSKELCEAMIRGLEFQMAVNEGKAAYQPLLANLE